MTVTDEPDVTAPAVPGGRSAGPRSAILLAAAIVIALLAGALVGRMTRHDNPGDNSIDAGFARDMSIHHSQAVEMAVLIGDRSTSPEIRILAHDIALTQQEQIGRMQGWLVGWDLSPTGSRPAMAWMGHAHGGPPAPGLLPDGRMPGMATAQQIAALRGLTGRPAEVLFLQLMVVHHRGGIAMANYAAAHAEQARIRDLAAAIAAGQTSEIKVLNQMLQERGVAPA